MRAFGAPINSRVPLGFLIRDASVMTRRAPVCCGKSRPVVRSGGSGRFPQPLCQLSDVTWWPTPAPARLSKSRPELRVPTPQLKRE
jgi:hypothetical protein